MITRREDPNWRIHGGLNVHDFIGGADFAAAGRIADLALQPIVGILPQWRIGADRNYRAGFVTCRTFVSRRLVFTNSMLCV